MAEIRAKDLKFQKILIPTPPPQKEMGFFQGEGVNHRETFPVGSHGKYKREKKKTKKTKKCTMTVCEDIKHKGLMTFLNLVETPRLMNLTLTTLICDQLAKA